MSITEVAKRISQPEETVLAVLHGKSSITPDLAVAFEIVTCIPAYMWLRHQERYDEFVGRKKREKIPRSNQVEIPVHTYFAQG